MKSEIEHIQHLLQKAKVQVQREFEQWWKQTRTSTSPPRAAWYTPPPASGSSAQSRQSSRQRPRRHQVAIAVQYSQGGSGGQPLSPTEPSGQYSSPSGPPNENSNKESQEARLAEQNSSGRGLGSIREDGARRVPGGAMERVTKQSSPYRGSWQQAESLSPPKPTRDGERGRSPPVSEHKYDERYLTKKKQLFSASKDFDSQIRLVSLSDKTLPTFHQALELQIPH